jgi:hypothetical protein
MAHLAGLIEAPCRFGSDSVLRRCPQHVRFSPDSDQTADIVPGRFRATSGYEQLQQIRDRNISRKWSSGLRCSGFLFGSFTFGSFWHLKEEDDDSHKGGRAEGEKRRTVAEMIDNLAGGKPT